MHTSPEASETSKAQNRQRGIIMVMGLVMMLAANLWSAAESRRLSLARLCDIQKPVLELDDDRRMALDLETCIARGLAYNLDIRAGSYEPAVRMSDVIQAEAAFDAVLYANASAGIVDKANIDTGYFERKTTTPSGTSIERIPSTPYDRIHDYNYSVGLRKRLPTGSVIQVAQLYREYRDLSLAGDSYYYDPLREFTLELQINQPLLKDFGLDVNRSSIIAARNNYRYSQQQFSMLVIDTVAEIERNYWQLVMSRQFYNIYEALYDEAAKTLEKLQARRSQDTNTELLTQTEALMARAKASKLSSLNGILEQQLFLLESINDPNLHVAMEWEIIPMDLPSQEHYVADYSAAVNLAMQIRPEIIAQRIRLETSDIAIGVAENQLLPRLDLFAKQEFNGAGVKAHDGWDKQWDGDTVNTTVGVNFEYPLGNREAEAFYQRTRKEKHLELAKLENIRQQIATDIKISLDAVTHSYDEILERTQAAQAELNTLEAYYTQIEAETGTTPGFLDRTLRAQERVASALLTLAQTIQRYNSAIMNAQRSQGTLLQYNNIKLEEGAR